MSVSRLFNTWQVRTRVFHSKDGRIHGIFQCVDHASPEEICMTRVVITAMLAWLAVGVEAVPARAAVDIHTGIPEVVIVPPSEHYDYPRYVYPDSKPRYY
jgi:hypothetical protein